MSDSTMRGMRLGAVSMESDRNVKLEARIEHEYRCASGHSTMLRFAETAEVPPTWECKNCSKPAALLIDGVPVEGALDAEKTPRSHWEMLLERRSREELQDLLDEQLENLRIRRASANARLSHG